MSMRRHLFIITLYICVGLLGFMLYFVSNNVVDKKRELARLENDYARLENEARALEAEWYFLNRPDRLEVLAREHLGWEAPSVAPTPHYKALDTMPSHKAPIAPRSKPLVPALYGGEE